jgi:hypothetical protein
MWTHRSWTYFRDKAESGQLRVDWANSPPRAAGYLCRLRLQVL